MLGAIVRFLLRIIYRVELRGREHYDAAGPRTLIIYNPGSILDPLILAAVLPHRVALLADRALEHKWWMRPVCALADTQFFDFSSPAATVSLVHALARNGRCMVFHSGSLGNDPRYIRILEAAGVIAQKADATLLPVRIDGASSTVFSYLRHKGRRRWFPRITVSVLEVQKFRSAEGVTPRERRRRMGERLYDIMTELEYRSGHGALQSHAGPRGGRPAFRPPLPHCRRSGQARAHLRFAPAQALGARPGLPTSVPGREHRGLSAAHVPAPDSWPSSVCIRRGSCRPCSTLRRAYPRWCPAAARSNSLPCSLRADFWPLPISRPWNRRSRMRGCASCTLKTWPKRLTLGDKALGALFAWLRVAPSTPADDPAAVRCSPRGTEGVPKAVLLSHVNIIANRYQALSTAHHRLRRQAVQLPAHVPRLRARHLHAAARARRRAGVPLSFAASLPQSVPRLFYGRPVHHHLRHDPLLRGLRALRTPLRFLSRAACHHRRGKNNSREHAPRVA